MDPASRDALALFGHAALICAVLFLPILIFQNTVIANILVALGMGAVFSLPRLRNLRWF
jgi:hypothetical protein